VSASDIADGFCLVQFGLLLLDEFLMSLALSTMFSKFLKDHRQFTGTDREKKRLRTALSASTVFEIESRVASDRSVIFKHNFSKTGIVDVGTNAQRLELWPVIFLDPVPTVPSAAQMIQSPMALAQVWGAQD
jgi:hypothetical protein